MCFQNPAANLGYFQPGNAGLAPNPSTDPAALSNLSYRYKYGSSTPIDPSTDPAKLFNFANYMKSAPSGFALDPMGSAQSPTTDPAYFGNLSKFYNYGTGSGQTPVTNTGASPTNLTNLSNSLIGQVNSGLTGATGSPQSRLALMNPIKPNASNFNINTGTNFASTTNSPFSPSSPNYASFAAGFGSPTAPSTKLI